VKTLKDGPISLVNVDVAHGPAVASVISHRMDRLVVMFVYFSIIAKILSISLLD
jgi:hypothetical protein